MMQNVKDDWLKMENFHEIVKETMTVGMIRNAILNRGKNGAAHFYRKIGKRIYLSPSRFYEWIDKEGKM